MGGETTSRLIWELVRRQHGVVTRRQLLALGLSPKAIEHRLRTGQLRRLWRGVYVVGRPELTQHGRWMAAVLACGPGALLSHSSAAALWGIRPLHRGPIEISVPRATDPRQPGIRVHRRSSLRPDDATERDGIPVTSPACTLVDIAPGLAPRSREAAINEADKLDLVHPEQLRAELEGVARPGATPLRMVLDRATFTLTDSDLERLFLPVARRAGLPKPETQPHVNGHRADFYWPDLKLVVEADGGRFHRTPLQQTQDRVRDQAHIMAGFMPLRFTHGQINFEPAYVERTLAAVARRLEQRAG
jgi:very-short-patch-repair endonuclease